MGLTTAYLVQVKNTKDIFEAIKQAQAPDKFTIKFLYDLGFTSTNDRGFVNMLKALGFLDDSGVPTQRYYDFLDDANSKHVLADGIREAYGDLFRVNNNAQDMTHEAVKGKLKTLLQGSKGEQVLTKMTSTFKTLCSLANFGQHKKTVKKTETKEIIPQKVVESAKQPIENNIPIQDNNLNLKYSINIELPATRDKAVYDAIFKSLKENIL